MVKMNGGGRQPRPRANSVGRSAGGDATRTGRVFTQPRPYSAAARELPPADMTTDLRKRTAGRRIVARPLGIRGKGVKVGGCGALAGG